MKDRNIKTSYKVVITGSTAVGKSSIIECLIAGTFPEDIPSTVGVEFRSFVCQLEDRAVRLQIWDTAGQERFRAVSTGYFREAVGAVLVYDITKEESFEDLGAWLTDLQQLCHPKAFILLVGNKCDLEDERKIGIQQVKEFADQYQLEYIETSAKSGQNIERTFTRLAYEIAMRVDTGAIDLIPPSAKGLTLGFELPPPEEPKNCDC
jgi:small GTP-binding protein